MGFGAQYSLFNLLMFSAVYFVLWTGKKYLNPVVEDSMFAMEMDRRLAVGEFGHPHAGTVTARSATSLRWYFPRYHASGGSERCRLTRYSGLDALLVDWRIFSWGSTQRPD